MGFIEYEKNIYKGLKCKTLIATAHCPKALLHFKE